MIHIRQRHPLGELFACAAIGAIAIGAPLGVGLWRSTTDDDPSRRIDYICIIDTGERCP